METDEGMYFPVKVKNKVLVGEDVEIITPDEQFVTKLISVKDENGIELPLGNTNDDVYVRFDKEPKDYRYAIARTIGVKENVS